MPNPLLFDLPAVLESERLLIRPPQPGDGPELRAAIADSFEELRVWMPWARTVPTLEEAELNVRQAWLDFQARRDLRWHLYLKGTDTLIGGSGLHRIDWQVPRFEIGYWVRTPYARRGYIREAVARISAFAFESLGAARLEIRCDPRNVRSRRVAEALGFRLEGTLRCESRGPDGSLRDTLVFARTAWP